MNIRYERLNTENFNGNSLDSFIRHQAIHESWRELDGQWKLVTNEFEENWSLEQCRETAADEPFDVQLEYRLMKSIWQMGRR